MYLITGATGNIGGLIAQQLRAAGAPVRVFVRDTKKFTSSDRTIEVFAGNFSDLESFKRALSGARGLFLLNRGVDPSVFRALINAATAAGVQHLVLLSSILAGRQESLIGKLHRDLEEIAADSPICVNFLRPTAFMSNARQWIPSIKSSGVVFNPLGGGLAPVIAPEDIAAVAVKLFLAPGATGAIYELTGGSGMSVDEQVADLSKAINRPLRCVEITVETAVEKLIESGIPKEFATAIGDSYRMVRNGQSAEQTERVAELLGRPPMAFAEWIGRHADEFR